MRSKKAFYNIVSNLILQIITVIYGFIIPKILITKFGSDVNGLVSSITQFLSYISLLESGFGPVVKSILYKPIANKDNKKIENILAASEKFFKNISYIFIIYIIILAIVYPLIIKESFNFMFTSSLIIIISISIFAEYYFGMTYKLFLQAEQKNYIISIVQIVTYILCAVVIVLLSMFDVSVHLIKLVGTLSFAIRPIFLNYYVKKKYQINVKKGDKNYNIKNKWDGLAQHIASVIHGNTDIAILTIFCNIMEVSVYSIYYLIIRGIKLIIQSFCDGFDALFGDMLAREESSTLNKKFNMYEVFFLIIVTILFSSTFYLTLPFISIYTINFNDVNYIRPLFCFFAILSEYVGVIRLPYLYLTYAAGHFKETKKGAWLECIVNFSLSIVLVLRFGLVGVVIGTFVAMAIRTIEFVYHSNKYILKRNILKSFGKIVLSFSNTFIVLQILKLINLQFDITYFNWVINSIIVVIIVSLFVLLTNYIFFPKEFKEIFNSLKKIIIKTKKIDANK